MMIYCLISCNIGKLKKEESPFELANDYCSCLEQQTSIAKDSLIDIYPCEKTVFSKSRLMHIYESFSEYGNYEKPTIDSARRFFLQVRNIIDTACLIKIERHKIKKHPHISM
jgi:hypothetical protein